MYERYKENMALTFLSEKLRLHNLLTWKICKW